MDCGLSLKEQIGFGLHQIVPKLTIGQGLLGHEILIGNGMVVFVRFYPGTVYETIPFGISFVLYPMLIKLTGSPGTTQLYQHQTRSGFWLLLPPPGIYPSGALTAAAWKSEIFRNNTVVIGQDASVAMLFTILSIAIICCADLVRCHKFVTPSKTVTESDYFAKLLQG